MQERGWDDGLKSNYIYCEAPGRSHIDTSYMLLQIVDVAIDGVDPSRLSSIAPSRTEFYISRIGIAYLGSAEWHPS